MALLQFLAREPDLVIKRGWRQVTLLQLQSIQHENSCGTILGVDTVVFVLCAYLVLRCMLEITFTSFLHLETRKIVESLGSMNTSSPSVLSFCAGSANRVKRWIGALLYDFQHFCKGRSQPKGSSQILDEISSLIMKL